MPQDLRKFVSVSAFTHESADITAQNADISPNFLVWKFSGNAQLPKSFGRFSVETLHFHKIAAPGNWVTLRYFGQRVIC